jgi:hypothetical protein
MRIVAALAALVKRLLPEPRQANLPCIPAPGRSAAGWLGRPSHRHRLLFGGPPAVTLFHQAFYRGLSLPCMEGYDPVHQAVISFRTGRK